MKIKDGYQLREVAGNYVVVPTGKATLDFSGVITLNGAGAFLWKLLSTEKTQEELLTSVLDEYDIDKTTALKDLWEFLDRLKAADLFA